MLEIRNQLDRDIATEVMQEDGFNPKPYSTSLQHAFQVLNKAEQLWGVTYSLHYNGHQTTPQNFSLYLRKPSLSDNDMYFFKPLFGGAPTEGASLPKVICHSILRLSREMGLREEV